LELRKKLKFLGCEFLPFEKNKIMVTEENKMMVIELLIVIS